MHPTTASLIASLTLLLPAAAIAKPGAAKTAPKLEYAPRGDHAATSTHGISFPEDGGNLPRAPMPEGGVAYPWHGEKKDPAADPKDPKPGDPSADATPPTQQHSEPGTGAHPPIDAAQSGVKIGWDGYLRVMAQVVENDPLPYIGRNDGFRLGDARLGLNAHYGDSLWAYISIDGAVAQSRGANDPNANLSVGLKDAFLDYTLAKAAEIRLGRFKVPYDLGEMEATEDRIFVDQPLETRGVAPTEGIEVRGMTQGRQLGLMLYRGRIGLDPNGFDLGYALALTNGRTDNRVFNDNDRPAGFARVSVYYGNAINLNVAGFIDNRTVGDLPNLFDEDAKGAEASLIIRIEGLRLEGQALLQKVDYPTTGQPSETVLGFHAQWSYRIWDIEAGYRFAYYDPSDLRDDDRVMAHTLALNYYFKALPVRLGVNGTFNDEQRALKNNRIDFLVQYAFGESPSAY